MKKTALYHQHEALQGKIVEFAGYLLPVNYPAGIIAEHNWVRQEVGMFDVSHMGEISVKGQRARAFLDWALTNNIAGLKPGKIRYTVMCYENGSCVDDLLVYCISEEEYLLVVNAANQDKDFQHLKALADDVEVVDVSAQYSQIAVQGPKSKEVLQTLFNLPEKFFSFVYDQNLLISQSGYTGELGYEIYGSHDAIVALWGNLITKGVKPCGLGCRDTLRFEAGLPLYGHEISDSICPNEAGLDFALKFDKEFIGKQAMLQLKEKRQLIGLRLLERGIARQGCAVYCGDLPVGVVTSGTMSPTLGVAIASALIKAEFAENPEFVIDIRGNNVKAEKTALPYYERENK